MIKDNLTQSIADAYRKMKESSYEDEPIETGVGDEEHPELIEKITNALIDAGVSVEFDNTQEHDGRLVITYQILDSYQDIDQRFLDRLSQAISEMSEAEALVTLRGSGLLQVSLDVDVVECWDDYEMIGTKKKNGKTVPNCVPKEGVGNLAKRFKQNLGPDAYKIASFIKTAKQYIRDLAKDHGMEIKSLKMFSQPMRDNVPEFMIKMRLGNDNMLDFDLKEFGIEFMAMYPTWRAYDTRQKGDRIQFKLRYDGTEAELPGYNRKAMTEEKNLTGKPLVNSLTNICLSSWFDLTKKFTSRPDVFDVHDEASDGSYNVFKMTPGNDVKDQAYEAAVSTTSKLAQALNKAFGKEVFEPRITRNDGTLETLVAFKSSKGGVFQCKARDNGGDSTIYLTMPSQEELNRAFSAMADVPTIDDEPDNGIDPEVGVDADPVAGDPVPDYDPEADYGDDGDLPDGEGDEVALDADEFEDEDEYQEEEVANSVGSSIANGDATANPSQTSDMGPRMGKLRRRGFTGGPFG